MAATSITSSMILVSGSIIWYLSLSSSFYSSKAFSFHHHQPRQQQQLVSSLFKQKSSLTSLSLSPRKEWNTFLTSEKQNLVQPQGKMIRQDNSLKLKAIKMDVFEEGNSIDEETRKSTSDWFGKSEPVKAKRWLPINDCNSVLEVIKLHRGERHGMSPTELSFCWNRVTKLIVLDKRERHYFTIKHNQDHLQSMLEDTTKAMRKFGPANVAATCHKLAKLVKICKLPINSSVWDAVELEIIKQSSFLSPMEISSTVWALATAKRTSPAVWQKLADVILSKEINEFNSQGISNILWGFAKVRHGASRKLFDYIANAGTPLSTIIENEFSSQEIANTVWAYATINHRSPKLFEEIAKVTVEQLNDGEFYARELANIAWAYAKTGTRSPKLFDTIAEVAMSQDLLDNFNPQNIANTVWAYAKLGHASPELFDEIAEVAIPRINEFWSQGIANTVWAFAKAGHASPDLFDEVGKVCVESSRIKDFKPQELSNTVWAYATLKHKSSPALLNEIASASLPRIHQFKSQGLANMVWAYATLNHHPTPTALLDKIAKVAAPRLDEFTSQGIANTVWAYATLKHPSQNLFSNIANVWTPRVHQFNSQGISNTVWAYATLKHHNAQFFDALANVALTCINEFNSQDLANTVWAYASRNHDAPELFDAIASVSTRAKLQDFSTQGLANMAWSYAKMGHYSPELFDNIVDVALPRLYFFSNQELANMVWAYASVGHNGPPELFDKIAEVVLSRLALELEVDNDVNNFNAQDLANIVWSYAVVSEFDSKNAVIREFASHPNIVNSILSFFELDQFGKKELCQLHQWNMWCQETFGEQKIPEDLSEKCLGTFSKTETMKSSLQDNIAKILDEIGVPYESEATMETGYSIDFLVTTKNGTNVALEADGPRHFLGETKISNGSTRMKHRQVRKLDGIKVVSVPYWEWNSIRIDNNNTMFQRAYLEELLELPLK